MSIVEETLNRLKSTGTPRPDGAPALALPPSLGEFPPSRGQSARRIAWWSALFVILGSIVWWGADRLMTRGNTVSPPAPPPIQAVAPAAPSAPEAPAAESGTVKAAAPAETQAAAAPAPAQDTPATSASAPDKAAAAPASASTTVEEVPALRAARNAPAWVAEGRKLLAAGDRKAALETWNAGFSALPPDTRLIALTAHPDAGGALAALAKLDDFDGAFVAQAAFRGKPAWRLLVFAEPKRMGRDNVAASKRLGIKSGAYVTVARLLPDSEKIAVLPTIAATRAPADTTGVSPANQVSSPPSERLDFDTRAAEVLTAIDHRSSSALSLAEELARDFPDRVEPLLWLARSELTAGKVEAAEKTLAQAAVLAPSVAEVWLLRGISVLEKGKIPEAIGFLEEALRLAPHNPDVLFNLALAAEMAGDVQRAREGYLAFLRKTHGDARYSHLRAWADKALTKLP
jgi:tetratricopeptide (TPR) repeat protein